MKKLRWAMDDGFWDLDMATPGTIDGTARAVPGDPLPLGLSRGMKLSRPKQLDFMHRFMTMPLVPCYAGDPVRGGDGFSLQRALAFPFGENCFATLLGQFHLQKFISSVKSTASRQAAESPWIKNIIKHLCDKSLYALGFCSEFLIAPDYSLLLSWEGYGNKKDSRYKAVFHQKLPQHNLTLEALWPGLFADNIGNYWDVPFSMAIDLASVASDSGLSYHLCMHHNRGKPKQYCGDETSRVPPYLQPGLCVKAGFSIKKDADIWRNKGGKLKMVQPFDIFMSDPHISVSGIIGTVLSASFGDSAVKLLIGDDSPAFSGLSLLAQGNKSSLSADLFASVSCSSQYGNFQRLFFDLTRLNARLDFPSGAKFIAGAALLASNLYKSQQPDMEAIGAVCPQVTLSFQQQIVGAFSVRVDSKISLGSRSGDRFAQVEESIFAVEYALKVLGSAKAIAWYSAKHQEGMVELRFFES